MIAAFMETMRMIKIEHSIFALPFAMVSAFWAANGVPEWETLGLIIVAMVFARSAAMAFNRWLDADIDAANPRTEIRSIPAGKLTSSFALGFTVICSLLFMLTTYFINQLALYLSLPFLVVLLGYSYMKRVTALCHVVLGIALGLSPLGAWIAVTGEFRLVTCDVGHSSDGMDRRFRHYLCVSGFGFRPGKPIAFNPSSVRKDGSIVCIPHPAFVDDQHFDRFGSLDTATLAVLGRRWFSSSVA